MKQTLSITRKELATYFGSPMALIFVAIFLVATLFSFFWISGFFERGIADMRPLFEAMPVLLILLVATLTMGQWSEEQQTGTLEMLLTMPIRLVDMVIGKFLAVLAVVALALLLTVSVPLTVAANGSLDWGPVIGGYLAALLMASAYIAIGLFVSSRTGSQIVSLLLTLIVCGLFYFIGSSVLTGLASAGLADFLRALGTGSRFESIQRGVIDVRDLVYYVTLTGIFLVLNIFSLDGRRWSVGESTRSLRFNRRVATLLVVANLVAFNLLISPLTVRADLTQDGNYSLSPVTKDLLGNLQEPLTVTGYFSKETHPLLAPLIPYVQDMLQEYKTASNGKMDLQFIDPISNPSAEQEANQTYGIRPTPLQVNDRGKTSVINAYMNILIRYGDQNVVLNLTDLIDVRDNGTGTPDVQLRNLEYDLTSSIQRVVNGFQSIGAVLASLKQPAQATLYVTPDTLPAELKSGPDAITKVANDIASQSSGKFVFKTVNVSDPKSGVTAQNLSDKYQIDPISAGFLSPDTFFLHIVIEANGKFQVIFPSNDFSDATLRSQVQSALERMSSGFLQVVGLWLPPADQSAAMFGQQAPQVEQFQTLQQTLSKTFDVRTVDLSTGQVGSDINALVLVGPRGFTDVERYAVDQYLMRGGSVFVASGDYQLTLDQQSGGLAVLPITDGLQDMLASYGVTVQPKLVVDPQNSAFPVQTNRDAGNGLTVNEIQAVPYAFFPDIRQNAMDQSSPVVGNLPSITVNWASPLTLDTNKLKPFQVSKLLQSSSNSGITSSTNLQPDTQTYPDLGFPVDGARGPQLLAVSIQGSFTSFFKNKASPFAAASTTPVPGPTPTPNPTTLTASASLVTQSPDTARLVVVGSAEFLNDTVFSLSQRLNDDYSANNMQFVQNSLDWFTQDTALSTIRSKGSESRVLNPLSDTAKTAWEIGNYVFALLSVIALGVVWQLRRRAEKPISLRPLPAASR